LDIDQSETQSDSELESFSGTRTDNNIAACTFDADLSDGESTDEEDTPPQGNADRLARQAHKRALRAAKQQKWKLARGLFEKAVVDFPSNVRILTSAAIFEQKQSRFGASRELFERAVAAGPQNAVALQVIYAWTKNLAE
jgi:tetratricopeptide (TPR) repeat protein